MTIILKRNLLFLLCGLLWFPEFALANEEKDTLSLQPSFNSKNIQAKKISIGLFNFKPVALQHVAKQPKKTWFKWMRFSGYTRFYLLYRKLNKFYDIPPTNGLTLPVNLTVGDGYQQPVILIRMEANPSARTWFQTELQFDHLFLRTTNLTNQYGRYANLYVIFQFAAAVDTRIGNLKMIAGGGVNWYRLSPATLWLYQYRDDMFERYPWEPEGLDFNRYNSFYAVGDIPRDQRFGMQGTQGFILEGTNMPKGFDGAVLYGKTSANAAFQSFLTKDPINVFGGRLGKKIGDQKIGFNYINQFGYLDNKVNYKRIPNGVDTFFVEDNRISQIVTSLDARIGSKNITTFTEVGFGSYLSNTYNHGLKDGAKPGVTNVSRYKRDWNPTAFFEIATKKEITLIPLKVNLYRIGTTIGNNLSSIANTSVEQAKPSNETPNEYYLNYYDGLVTDIGQLANNRQGINLFAYKLNKRLKTRFAIGMSQEITNLVGDLRNGARANFVAGANPDSLTKVPFTNSITFEHRLNALPRSRFAFFKRFTGPYNRIQSSFRRTFENIVITDTVVDYKKSFSTIDLELKYKFRFLGKELILSNFNNISSVQDQWSPIPVITNKAFLRYFYEEFMAFYSIHPKVTLVGFLGYERVIGNNRTELADANGNLIKNAKGRPVADPNGKPISQTGHGYGLGTDYNFQARASLHLRYRWYNQKDKNFTLDEFKGNEMTIEFKVFF